MSMYRLHDEPKLNELLADPILHLLLKRDGVSLEKLQDLIEQARQRRWGAKRAQLQ
jgi:mevalonate kinase